MLRVATSDARLLVMWESSVVVEMAIWMGQTDTGMSWTGMS